MIPSFQCDRNENVIPSLILVGVGFSYWARQLILSHFSWDLEFIQLFVNNRRNKIYTIGTTLLKYSNLTLFIAKL